MIRGTLRRGCSGFVRRQLVRKVTERREVVLDLLVRHERGLAVVGDGFVECPARLLVQRVAAAGIQQRQGGRGTRSPEAARRVEPGRAAARSRSRPSRRA